MSDKLGLSSDLPIDWKLINSVVPFESSLREIFSVQVFFSGFDVGGRGTQLCNFVAGSGCLIPAGHCWREATGHGGMGGATLPPLPEEDQ